MRLDSAATHPSPQAIERETRKRQRDLHIEETRLRDKPIVDAITAWHAVLTQQIERQRALIEERERVSGVGE